MSFDYGQYPDTIYELDDVNDEDLFRHIDWCSSTGPYNAPDCDCPGSDIDLAAEHLGLSETREEYLGRQLPRAPKVPERRALESYDRENTICVHELARAMEEYATGEPVQLYGGSVEFQEAAQRVLELAHKYRCGLKGR